MSVWHRKIGFGWLVAAAFGLCATGLVEARPVYFDALTTRYDIAPEDRTYVCGNCHYRWNGTGARNDFGSAVEQQLYAGKSISQALADLEPMDADGDGFTNLEELATHQTLPGYSCSNFFLADGAPIGYDTFITPLVPSCLEPKDIRISPTSLSFITKAGTSDVVRVQVINNGRTDPIAVSSYGFVAGSHPALSVSGPPLPLVLNVGEIAELDVTFSPPSAIIATGTLRIASDDPDEPTIDLSAQAFGFTQTLASVADRVRCLKSVDKELRRYSDRLFREWNRCFVDEVRGLACDVGTRELEIAQAETRFRDAIGGSKDKVCAGELLNASLLGLPASCGGTCDQTVTSMASFASCLVCRANEGRDEMLRQGIGTAPPDSPSNVAGTTAANRCEKQIASRIAKGIASIQKILGRCELANVGEPPVDCAAANASALTKIRKRVDEARNRCTDSTGLLGCLYEGGTENCLGDAATSIGSTLVDAIFPDAD
jgi:hypothetical protein